MRTVLVTGATRGVGLAIAARLLDDGYQVVGTSRTLSEQYETLQAAQPSSARFLPFDLADLEGIPALARQVRDEVGDLYGLVNNAGVARDGVLATLHAKDIETVLAVNLHAPILLTKHLSRGMLRRREGRIINITSIVARTGFNGLSVYGAAKAGLEGFTRSLAREVGRANITVNAVAPGYMETDMTSSLAEEHLESIRRRSPLGLVTGTDVAGVVAFLLSEDASHITGTTVTVDGGSTA